MYDSTNWPIAAALLQFPGTKPDGTSVQDEPAEGWAQTLREVRNVGFDAVDLTDSWLKPGRPARPPAGRVQGRPQHHRPRRPVSVHCADQRGGSGERAANFDYTLRSIEAAAELGVGTLSLGLHQQLTPAQRQRLWFWTAEGAGVIRPATPTPAAGRAAVPGNRQEGQADYGTYLCVPQTLTQDTYLDTADSAVRLIEDIGLANVAHDPASGTWSGCTGLSRAGRKDSGQDPVHQLLAGQELFPRPRPGHWSVTIARAPLELGFMNYRQAYPRSTSGSFTECSAANTTAATAWASAP